MASKFVVLALLVAAVHGSGLHGADHTSFSYGVSDPHTGDVKSQHETRSGGNVVGQYSLLESDGTRRTVDYAANDHTGFNAVVRRDPALVAHAAPAVVAAPVVAAAPAAYAANWNVAHAAPLAYAAPLAHGAAWNVAHAAPLAYAAPLAHGAVAHGAVAHGVVAHGAIAHGAVAHGAVAHGAVAYGAHGVHGALVGAHGLGYARLGW